MEEDKTPSPEVVIYTDGACVGNPGPGGYGVVLKFGSRIRELSGGYRLTTNNHMEIMAAIVALQALKRVLCTFAQKCAIVTDLADFSTAHQTAIEYILPV